MHFELPTRFGSDQFGGCYAPETLMTPLLELEHAFIEAMADPAIIARFRDLGAEPWPLPTDAYRAFIAGEVKRWAEVRPVGAVAYAASVQSDERVTHRMRMRLFSRITTKYEVVWNGWVYRVRRAKHEHDKRETLLEVEEQRRVDDESEVSNGE